MDRHTGPRGIDGHRLASYASAPWQTGHTAPSRDTALRHDPAPYPGRRATDAWAPPPQPFAPQPSARPVRMAVPAGAPALFTPAPIGAAPVSRGPIAPAPVAFAPAAPAPVVLEPVTSIPFAPARVASAPITPLWVAPAAVQPVRKRRRWPFLASRPQG